MAQVAAGFRPSEIPVFRSRQDSIRLEQINDAIADCQQRQPPDPTCLDTLLAVRRKIVEEGIVRYIRIYSPTHDYVPFDSLRFIKDLSVIRRVTISNRRLRGIPAPVLQCTNLQTLEIVNCRLRRLPENTGPA